MIGASFNSRRSGDLEHSFVVARKGMKMMKLLLSLLMVTMLGWSCEAGSGDVLDQYDLVAIAKDDKQFQRVSECLALDVPCDNLQGLKENGAIVIKTNCGDCTPKQKEKFEQFKAYMKEAHPKELEAIMQFVSQGGVFATKKTSD